MNPIPGAVPDVTPTADVLRKLTQPYWIPVSGGSMYPVLRDGDLAWVEPIHAGDVSALRAGDLILFTRNELPIIHRYAGRFQGRHCERADRSGKRQEITTENILGVVSRRKRGDKIRELPPPLRWRIFRVLNLQTRGLP